MTQPTMQAWTDAWHEADAGRLQQLYAAQGYVFPPNKPTVSGNAAIIDFFRGGLGKVNVIFGANELLVGDTVAFEAGVFRDVDRNTEAVIASGSYSVTWVAEDGEWKIKCHTWSMPVK